MKLLKIKDDHSLYILANAKTIEFYLQALKMRGVVYMDKGVAHRKNENESIRLLLNIYKSGVIHCLKTLNEVYIILERENAFDNKSKEGE